jgi:hypothetical protein
MTVINSITNAWTRLLDQALDLVLLSCLTRVPEVVARHPDLQNVNPKCNVQRDCCGIAILVSVEKTSSQGHCANKSSNFFRPYRVKSLKVVGNEKEGG